MRPRKLLIVVNDAAFFLSHRLPIALGAREHGYDVHIATPRDVAATRIEKLGLPFHAIPLSRRGTSPATELATIAALTSLYRRLAPDIVHHVTAKPILYGGIAARIANVPAVVHAVSGLGHVFISSRPRARAIRQLIRGTYRVITEHPRCAVIFQNEDDRAAFGSAIRTSRVVLIPGSGVDRALFPVTPLPEGGTPLVVVPSRMLWDKGIGEVVEAARQLRAKGTDLRVALVGDTDDGNPAAIPVSTLREWVDQGAVEWWGRREDMAAVMMQSTLVCLPSYREGMPKSLLEAVASGRPIVTTDVPGCRDVVAGTDVGMLVPARDSLALAQTIGALLGDRPKLLRMAEAAAANAPTVGVEHVVARTLKLYGDLLDGA